LAKGWTFIFRKLLWGDGNSEAKAARIHVARKDGVEGTCFP